MELLFLYWLLFYISEILGRFGWFLDKMILFYESLWYGIVGKILFVGFRENVSVGLV